MEDLLAERGIIVSYEAIRQWCRKFGPDYARRLKCKQGRLGDTWYLDELFVRINGQQQYLWRAVDQDGNVCCSLGAINVQPSGSFADCCAVKASNKRPFRIITDKLKSYSAATRTILLWCYPRYPTICQQSNPRSRISPLRM